MIRATQLDAIWAAAVAPEFVCHSIQSSIVSELESAAQSALRLIPVEKRDQRKHLWELLLTVRQTMLPFDDSRLGLLESLDRIVGSTKDSEWIADLRQALSLLIAHGLNPKRVVLEEIYCGEASGAELTLWTRPQSGAPYGWPEGAAEEIAAEFGSQLTIPPGFNEVPIFGETLLLSSPLRGLHFLEGTARKLIRRGRWNAVHLLCYHFERTDFVRSLLNPVAIQGMRWKGAWSQSDVVYGTPVPASAAAVEEEPPYEEWIWGVGVSDSVDAPVRAVGIRLGDNKRVAYRSDRTVRLLNSDRGAIPVDELTAGDLIPVRTGGGGGEALDDAANDYLAGRQTIAALEASINEWKATIRTCLLQEGEIKLLTAFQRHTRAYGTAWRADAWTASEPFGPSKWEAFHGLLSAAKSLGYFRSVTDMDRFAQSHWRVIEKLRTAKRQGGRALEHLLDDALEKAIAPDRSWRVRDEIVCPGSERKYLVCEVIEVRDVGEISLNQLERLMQWQS